MLSQYYHKIDRQNPKSLSDRETKDIFAIHGGGNIGLGLMADIIARSQTHFQVIATSNDPFLVRLINDAGRYALHHHTNQNPKANSIVRNVRMVSRSPHDVIELYKNAKIVAICLTPVALTSIAEDIARGLILRNKINEKHIDILVLMNIPRCDEFVKEKVISALISLGHQSEDIERILINTQFIPTVVDRIVTKINEVDVKANLKQQLLNSFDNDKIAMAQLHSQLDNIISNPERLSEAIHKFNLTPNLFNAEEDYALYISKHFIHANLFPSMKQVQNLDLIETVKNKYINGPHAIIAWMGALLGCKTIAEAIRIPAIKKFIKKMMDEEIRPILMAEYPELLHKDLDFLRKLFIKRCLDSISDPVTRVGRDPLRKINANGRIRGTIELAKKHGIKLPLACLEQGLASAILYATRGMDDANEGCAKIRYLYKKSGNDYKAVLCYTGDSPAGVFQGLDPSKDKHLIQNILRQIKSIENMLISYEIKQNIAIYNDKLKQVHSRNEGDFLDEKPMSTYHMMAHINHHINNTSSLPALSIMPSLTDAPLFTKKSAIYLGNCVHKANFTRLHSSSKFFSKMDTSMNIQQQLFTLGIILDNQNGHLSYSDHFKPFDLGFELVFVRHGETYGNCGQTTMNAEIDYSLVKANKKDYKLRVFQGNVDTEINQLTDYGKKQAFEVALKLERELLQREWIPDLIFHSPLSRAKQTGETFIMRNGFSNRYISFNLLREMSFGSWDNRRVCDLDMDEPCHAFYNDQNALVKESGINANGVFQVSESFSEVLIRAQGVLQYFSKQYEGKKVIMFSHSMFGAACCILLGKGQQHEYGRYLAFDGTRSDGSYYTMPSATPYFFNVDMSELKLKNSSP